MVDKFKDYIGLISFYNWNYTKTPFEETKKTIEEMIKWKDINGLLQFVCNILEIAFKDTEDLAEVKTLVSKKFYE